LDEAFIKASDGEHHDIIAIFLRLEGERKVSYDTIKYSLIGAKCEDMIVEKEPLEEWFSSNYEFGGDNDDFCNRVVEYYVG